MDMYMYGIFSDNMMFQANKPIRVFGYGDGDVKAEFCGCRREAVSKGGKWEIEFDAMGYGGPYTMDIYLNGEQRLIKNIMVGEVILCAGQSNMQFTIGEEELDSSVYGRDDMLRTFVVDRMEEYEGLKSKDGWVISDKDNIKFWSAIGYHVGEIIRKNKDIAVGIIGCYQGASVIQSWLPEESFENKIFCIPEDMLHDDHKNEFAAWNKPSMIYHDMFEKIIPYSVGNVIWYQGESNTSIAEGKVYARFLSELIRVWRRDFKDDKLHVTVVQICDYINRDDEGWKLVQKAQKDICDMVDYVKMAESFDVCSHENIHPPIKTKLSQRIAEMLE